MSHWRAAPELSSWISSSILLGLLYAQSLNEYLVNQIHVNRFELLGIHNKAFPSWRGACDGWPFRGSQQELLSVCGVALFRAVLKSEKSKYQLGRLLHPSVVSPANTPGFLSSFIIRNIIVSSCLYHSIKLLWGFMIKMRGRNFIISLS